MPTKTEAIKSFLMASTHSDLASYYDLSMECQVIVAQDNGERVNGEYKGIKWFGYTDGNQTWKSFRIPYKAMSEPSYDDTDIKFDLGLHVEGIGMTGWDWKRRCSKWVAFDFDSIAGHSDNHSTKLNAEEMRRVEEAACNLDWVTVRKSTSGKGLHLYVFVNNIPSINHTVHSALARAILSKMSALTGYDFKSKVDICGGNMWVWHRKMLGTDGLSIIKQGTVLDEIPPNWHEYVQTKTKKPHTAIDDVTAQRMRVTLDSEHLRLTNYLEEEKLYYWWDQDKHMLVTHTLSLKKAHTDLGLRGIFETDSKGTTTHNCFLYPMRKGAWSVRRYSQGVKEHASWDGDGSGWTRCYYNREPTLAYAAKANEGLEDPSGGFVFRSGEEAMKAALSLGADLNLPQDIIGRKTTIKQHKDGARLIVETASEQHDNPSRLKDWLQKGGKWIRIFNMNVVSDSETDQESFDDTVRHLVSHSGVNAGWVLNVNGKWNEEPLPHVKHLLKSMSLKNAEVDNVIGSSVIRPWILTSVPFKPEYPGDRVWNRFGPQFKFPPTIADVFKYPTWQKILDHIGGNITESVERNQWCKEVGIVTGGDYLKVWIASMIQFPYEPLPYLFIYGTLQETGKSTLHEALEMLFSPGYQNVGHALQNTSTFNAELEGTILGVIEELDLSNKTGMIYNRVKDWATSRKISIHCKYATPYLVDNTAHFIHTTNNRAFCPIFPGDTRIMMINVRTKPKEEIPKRVLFKELEKEASDFLGMLTTLEIPEYNGRLRLPVIETEDKHTAESYNTTPVERFIQEMCFWAPGRTVLLSDFFDRFVMWLDPNERSLWATKQKVSSVMPDCYPKGRLTSNPSWYWGNISFTEPPEEEKDMPPYISFDGKLIRKM